MIELKELIKAAKNCEVTDPKLQELQQRLANAEKIFLSLPPIDLEFKYTI